MDFTHVDSLSTDSFQQGLQQLSHELHLVTDAYGIIVYSNHLSSTLLGIDQDSLIGLTLGEVIQINDGASFNEICARARAKSNGDVVVTAKATQIHLACSCQLMDEHLLICARVFSPDHETDQDIIADLQAKEERVKHALNLVNVGYWRWSPSTDDLIWSEETYRLVGLDPERDEADVEKYFSAIHPEDFEQVKANFDHLAKTGIAKDQDHRFVHADGRVVHVYARAQVIKDDQGNVLYLFGTIQDVTEQKRQERELKRAKKIADAANVAKNEFLTSMGHELRTPLNAISGFTQLLALEQLSLLQRQYVNEISTATLRFEAMMETAFDISNLDFIQLERSPLKLQECVQNALNHVQELASNYRVSLFNALGEKPDITLVGDYSRLQQIIKQLVINGVKYNKPQGSVKIDAQVTENGKLKIDVIDTGVGIEAKHRHKIFKPFSRIVKEKNVIPGTGLGLTLCQQLLHIMGGEIDFVSVPGEGTHFWIVVPTT